MDDALKTTGNIYLNVETSLLFAPTIKISGYVPGISLMVSHKNSYFTMRAVHFTLKSAMVSYLNHIPC